MGNLRSKVFDLPYGDQGLLIHRDLLTSIGGFPNLPIMEDVALAGKLKSKFKPLNIIAQTSAKKYHKKGWLRQSLINFSILIRFKLGQDTDLLYNLYYKVNLKKFATFRLMRLFIFFANPSLCVAINAAISVPSTSDKSASNTVSEVLSSKLPVGSSASKSFGLLATALQKATRCCSPPDS